MNIPSPSKPCFLEELSGTALKVGIWQDGWFEWVSIYENEGHHLLAGSHIRLQEVKENGVSLVKVIIENDTNEKKRYKVVLQYENRSDWKNVSFYSPSEQAILQVGQDDFELIGGIMDGKGISQYCIQEMEVFKRAGFFNSLQEGCLTFSPLAKGRISNTYSLEAEVAPQFSCEAIAWVIQASTKEAAKKVNTHLFSKWK